MSRLAVICARGGSKGVKGKNLRPIAGKPLIAHTIEQARQSALFDCVAVSSDSADIRAAGREWGADQIVERPDELASDSAAKVPAIRHCTSSAEERTGMRFDTIVDLDATAPLRIVEDIHGAVRLLEDGPFDNVVSGAPARRSPYFNLVERNADGRVHLSKPPSDTVFRRQDSPACFDLNASIFVWSRDMLFSDWETPLGDNTGIFVMPEERSIDIDTETDFLFVEFMLDRRA